MKPSTPWLASIFFSLIAPHAMASEASDAKAYDLAFKTIRQSRLLTTKQLDCVFLMIDDNDGKVATVDVREKHNKKCGGAPETAPQMFSLNIDLKTGAVQWDGNDDMEMRPVPRQLGDADTWQPLGQGWSRYNNSRFGTIAEIPALFKSVDLPPENGDGRAFNADDGARLWVSASYGPYVVTDTFAAYKVWLAKETKPERATYKAEGKGWLVLSGIDGSTVVYTKVIEGCGAGHEVHIEYPVPKRAFYDPIVTRLSRTLRCQTPRE
ncbi:hypothetical protein [Microvirga antarctica]|uniref:hypothetical protein n=1 Tax=Microvirga antarctica TaxID=2819233 RepID=UPI001B315386|nr:hypothetical protein [Microvirga antarctica]